MAPPALEDVSGVADVPSSVWNREAVAHLGRWVCRESRTARISIGFVGPSNSGKTTLFNALLARAVIPSASDGLSTGLLVVSDGGSVRLTVSDVRGAWTRGVLSCPDESIARVRIQALLFAIKHARARGAGANGPRIDLELDLAIPRAMLCVPEYAGFEIVDAPGMRLGGDRSDDVAIDEALRRSRPVVVLDATRLWASEDIEATLTRVKAAHPGDSIQPLVVLNKIDRLGSEDPSALEIERRFEEDGRRFFAEPIEVVSTSALLLAGATEMARLASDPAWDVVLKGATRDGLRLARARALLADGTCALRRSACGDPAAMSLLRAVEDSVDQGCWSQGTSQAAAFARQAFAAANGTKLISALQRVVFDSGPRQQPAAEPSVTLVARECRARLVGEMFRAMIEADGEAREEEIILAGALAADYDRGHGVRPGIAGEIGRAPPSGVDPREAILAFVDTGPSIADREWCLGALLGLAVVDKHLNQSELALLELAERLFGLDEGTDAPALSNAFAELRCAPAGPRESNTTRADQHSGSPRARRVARTRDPR